MPLNLNPRRRKIKTKTGLTRLVLFSLMALLHSFNPNSQSLCDALFNYLSHRDYRVQVDKCLGSESGPRQLSLRESTLVLTLN